MTTKRQLAKELENLSKFKQLDIKKEQYTTPGDIASQILWEAFMLGDIEYKKILDLGCGNGILGIGALLLGAKEVIFIDIDKEALDVCKHNVIELNNDLDQNYNVLSKCEFIISDVNDLDINKIKNYKINTVIMNPPFGTKIKHVDKEFLKKAIEIVKNGGTIYSFHKSSTLRFVDTFCKDNNKKVTHKFDFKYPLYSSYKFHEKPKKFIDVSVVRIK